MEQKYAWTTLLTSKNYLQSVLNLRYSLRRVRSEYPLVVIIPDSIALELIPTLMSNDCLCYIVPDMQRMIENSKPGREFSVDMLMKFFSFELTAYDKVCYLDGDILLLKNCDFVFNYRTPAAKHLNWHYRPIQEQIKMAQETGGSEYTGIFAGEMMLLEPGTFSMDYFLNRPSLSGCWDEAVLRDVFGPQQIANLYLTDTNYIYHAHATGHKNLYWQEHGLHSEEDLNHFLDRQAIDVLYCMDWNKIPTLPEESLKEEDKL